VGRNNYGDSFRLFTADQIINYVSSRFRIQIGKGLIEQQNAGIRGNGTGEGKTLLFAS
jgi:hypothetical protein